jgi:allantoin racemase
MPTLLVINPNTSVDIDALLGREALARAPADVAVRVAGARFGARYISGEIGAAIAAHAALDAYAHDVAAHGVPDAVLLACFGDPGLAALRALSPAPVVGLAEAAMHRAAAIGPFAVLTGGAAWAPILERFAASLALPAPLLGVHCLAGSAGALAQASDADTQLAEGARAALSRWPQARALLLGGAGLAGRAAALHGSLPVPVLDNVQLALDAAFAVATQAGCNKHPVLEPGPWATLSPELHRLLAPP